MCFLIFSRHANKTTSNSEFQRSGLKDRIFNESTRCSKRDELSIGVKFRFFFLFNFFCLTFNLYIYQSIQSIHVRLERNKIVRIVRISHGHTTYLALSNEPRKEKTTSKGIRKHLRRFSWKTFVCGISFVLFSLLLLSFFFFWVVPVLIVKIKLKICLKFIFNM